jgi:riboflavin synthase
MFTGIVETLGRIERVVDEGEGRRLIVQWPHLAEPLAIGESVAVNGCCLTVVKAEGSTFEVQAGPETLARTNLGAKAEGDVVNLERALRVGDRLGGHFVQGHIDTTAVLRQRRPEGEWEFLGFAIESAWTSFMVPKGSIAVDGVSLTLVEVERDSFSVMLIPHTLAVTTLGRLAPGDRVNIEVDILAKHVQKFTDNLKLEISNLGRVLDNLLLGSLLQ